MKVVTKLEKTLAGLYKDAPALPNSSRETLAALWPWLALVFGVLQLAAAWALWRLTRVVDGVLNYYASYVDVRTGLSGYDKTVIYAGIVVLAIDAGMLLMAVAPLRARQARGWDLLFLGSLLNVLYAFVSLFIEGRGAGSFILSLLGSAVGFYLLFQVKSKFRPVRTAPHRASKN